VLCPADPRPPPGRTDGVADRSPVPAPIDGVFSSRTLTRTVGQRSIASVRRRRRRNPPSWSASPEPSPRSTLCYGRRVAEIAQRELRNDNAEIIRRVEAGETFVVTRNGVPVAELRPLPAGRQRVVHRDRLAEVARRLDPLDGARLRADLDDVADPWADL
jgi:prevent-host-death family protein